MGLATGGQRDRFHKLGFRKMEAVQRVASIFSIK